MKYLLIILSLFVYSNSSAQLNLSSDTTVWCLVDIDTFDTSECSVAATKSRITISEDNKVITLRYPEFSIAYYIENDNANEKRHMFYGESEYGVRSAFVINLETLVVHLITKDDGGYDIMGSFPIKASW